MGVIANRDVHEHEEDRIVSSRHRNATLVALAALVALGFGAPALGDPGAAPAPPIVLAQADRDPMAEGSVDIRREAGEEGLDADVRFEFGAEEEGGQPPVSAAPDGGGVPVLWVVLGLGALMIVLLVVLLSRGGGTTVVRD